MKFMNRWGSEVCVSGSIDLNLRELIDRKKLRFMGNACAYGFLASEMAQLMQV